MLCRADDFNIISPGKDSLRINAGEMQVHLNRDGCEAGFEIACSTVLQRSEYVSTRSHSHGDSIAYGWEIRVPEDFRYNASGGYLRAVRFINAKGESVLSFLIDTQNGYNVSRKTCFSPKGFGSWHRIEVFVTWDSTKKKGLKDKTPGELQVICDGTEILNRLGRPNIGAEEQVWMAVGLAGSLKLADGDNAAVTYRNISIEPRQ